MNDQNNSGAGVEVIDWSFDEGTEGDGPAAAMLEQFFPGSSNAE